jgi:aspartyl-tRNA(Asn)/glutamyl-tRNA(Gln) amidotransferase subunit C
VAELAHLELKAEETPRMLNDLNAILEYVAELNELDTARRGAAGPGQRICWMLRAEGRELRAGSWCGRRWIGRKSLSQAPETDGVFFQGSQGD